MAGELVSVAYFGKICSLCRLLGFDCPGAKRQADQVKADTITPLIPFGAVANRAVLKGIVLGEQPDIGLSTSTWLRKPYHTIPPDNTALNGRV